MKTQFRGNVQVLNDAQSPTQCQPWLLERNSTQHLCNANLRTRK